MIPEVNPTEFGKYIRKLRKERSLSMGQLEKLSGVSSSYIANIETGKRKIPSPAIIRKLAKSLGVELFQLLEKAGHLGMGDASWGNDDPRIPQNSFLYMLNSNKNLSYKDRVLTDKDKERIETMMETLFPEE